MPRYIDAEKTKEHKFAEARFERYFGIISSGRATTDDVIYAYKVGYNEAIDNILDFEPTADVVERKKGKWIKGKKSLWSLGTCSVCGAISVEADTANYCPNCGAKMRGEEYEM